jgi:hypothetical protein
MNNTEWLRKRLLRDVQVYGTHSRDTAELALQQRREHLQEIAGHAAARTLMGSFRYEQAESDGLSYDDKMRLGLAPTYLKRLEDKIALYRATGNQEFLVDAFNYIILEWGSPSIDGAFFESNERYDDES